MKDHSITDEKYKRAHRIWKIGGCKTIKDYVLIYLNTDVDLLCNVLQDWRKLFYDRYFLDMAHYVSLPSFACDAFLYQSKMELDHMYEYKMY